MARRAAIYIRESQLQDDDRWGILVQRDHAEEYCREKGYEIVREYVDPEADSYEIDRPALDELRQDMKAGLIDVIVVDRFDRMARRSDVMDFIRGEAKVLYDVDLEFTLESQQFDMSTPLGRLNAHIQAYSDQLYREQMSRNTQNARKARAKAKKILPTRYVPWGWQYTDSTRSDFKLNPATAPLRKRLCDDTLAGKLPIEIARDLTAEKVPMPSGKIGEWHAPTVTRLLKETILKGEYVINRWSYRKERRVKKDGRVYHPRVMRQRPENDPDRVVKQVEPLISVEEFDLIQAIIAGRRQNGNYNFTDPHPSLLYGGMVKCGYCGQSMHQVNRKDSDGLKRYFYRCMNVPVGGKRCGSGNIVSAAFLDKHVWHRFASFLCSPDELQQLYKDWVDQVSAGMGQDEKQLAFLDKMLADLDKSIALKIKRLSETENDEVAAGLQLQLDIATGKRDNFRQMRADAIEREQYRCRMHANQEQLLAFMRTAWDWLHEEGDAIDLRRGFLLAFDVRVVC